MKIGLFLPGNSFHANLLPGDWARYYEEKCGLEVIGKSGIPVAVSFQKIDLDLLPFILDELKKYQNISLISSTNNHGLLPLLINRENQSWECFHGVEGDVPICFFSEFFSPPAEIIPAENFLVLSGHSYAYSQIKDVYVLNKEIGDISIGKIPEKIMSIKVGRKTGLLMRDELMKGFLTKFFVFQRDPLNDKSVNDLFSEIERLGNLDRPSATIIPLDLEAPFVGSLWGSKVWKIFFIELKKRKLESIFVPISQVAECMAGDRKKSLPPQRLLDKFMVHPCQNLYQSRLNHTSMNINFEFKSYGRANLLFSIASCSDIFACWFFKVSEAFGKFVKFPVKDISDQEKVVNITFNPDIIYVQLMAYNCLVMGQSFRHKLTQKKKKSLFIKRMIEYAEFYDL